MLLSRIIYDSVICFLSASVFCLMDMSTVNENVSLRHRHTTTTILWMYILSRNISSHVDVFRVDL